MENILPFDDIRLEIKKYLYDRGIALTWFAKQIDTDMFHLHCVLKGKKTLTDKLLSKINKELGTDFKKTQDAKEETT